MTVLRIAVVDSPVKDGSIKRLAIALFEYAREPDANASLGVPSQMYGTSL